MSALAFAACLDPSALHHSDQVVAGFGLRSLQRVSELGRGRPPFADQFGQNLQFGHCQRAITLALLLEDSSGQRQVRRAPGEHGDDLLVGAAAVVGCGSSDPQLLGEHAVDSPSGPLH